MSQFANGGAAIEGEVFFWGTSLVPSAELCLNPFRQVCEFRHQLPVEGFVVSVKIGHCFVAAKKIAVGDIKHLHDIHKIRTLNAVVLSRSFDRVVADVASSSLTKVVFNLMDNFSRVKTRFRNWLGELCGCALVKSNFNKALTVITRVSDLLCMSNSVHASLTKEHEDNDDYEGSIRRAAERG